MANKGTPTKKEIHQDIMAEVFENDPEIYLRFQQALIDDLKTSLQAYIMKHELQENLNEAMVKKLHQVMTRNEEYRRENLLLKRKLKRARYNIEIMDKMLEDPLLSIPRVSISDDEEEEQEVEDILTATTEPNTPQPPSVEADSDYEGTTVPASATATGVPNTPSGILERAAGIVAETLGGEKELTLS